MTEDRAILEANGAFYTAFSTGDIESMMRLWADDDGVSCIHPGWPAIVGRTAVLRSWRDILLSGNRPRVVCQAPYAIVGGLDGRVLCIEIIGSSPLAASNHFRQINGVWRLVHHQAGQIAASAEPPPAEDGEPPRTVH